MDLGHDAARLAHERQLAGRFENDHSRPPRLRWRRPLGFPSLGATLRDSAASFPLSHLSRAPTIALAARGKVWLPMKVRAAPASVPSALGRGLSATAATGSSLTAIGLATLIAPLGQAWTQASHSVHSSELIWASPPTS